MQFSESPTQIRRDSVAVRSSVGQREAFWRGKELPSVERADLALNQILAALPSEETRRVLANLELIHVQTNDILAEGGVPISHCYFPLDAVVALVANLEEGATVEVGLIGNEGMVGIRVILGRSTGAYLAVVQIPGKCLRIKPDLLKAEFKRGGVLQDRLLQYVRYMLAQVSQTAACNRMHLLEQRLCRWLLSIQDRVKTDELLITHEAIAHMLGATRSDVSRVVGALGKLGILHSSRGKTTILDRKALESTSCECYWIVRNDYIYPLRARKASSGKGNL